MWDVRRNVSSEGMPADRRFVARFQFSGVPANRRRYWIVFNQGDTDLCIKDPGYEVDLYISSHVRTLTEIWIGHASIRQEQRAGRLTFDGSRKDISAFSKWFALSPLAKFGSAASAAAEGT
jgi:hypothetical protein